MEDASVTADAWPAGSGVVTFPDGTRVRGRALRARQPVDIEPDLGVYLLGRAPEPVAWECRWIRWPDLRLPSDRDDAVAQLVSVADAAATRRVEVACGGGRGRTGTALAVIAIACGVDRADAVPWVRAHYHRRAVETPWQRRWVESLEIV